MPFQTYSNKFNRGEVSKSALFRTDVEKIKDSSRRINNFLPMRLGGAQYRPGLEYLGDMAFTNEEDTPYIIPFVKSVDDKAIIEFNRGGRMRIWLDGDTLLTRPNVSSTITNGTFGSDLSGWSDADTGDAVSAYGAGGFMKFINTTGVGTGKRFQVVNSSLSSGVEHSLRIHVLDGPIHLAIGASSVDSDEYFSGVLTPGIHSLTFTPASVFAITFTHQTSQECRIDQCTLEANGTFEILDASGLNIPHDVANANIRYAQSLDVVYVATDVGRNFAIERRGEKSWSVVDFYSEYGPFGQINGNTNLTLTPGGQIGAVTIGASQAYFKSEHLGALLRIISPGQERRATFTANGLDSGNIRVTGVGGGRDIFISVQGTFVATIQLQSSVDEVSWANVSGETYTTPTNKIYNDGFENAILYYRLLVTTYSSGSAVTIIRAANGTTTGIARIIAVNSATVVTANVIEPFGWLDPTPDWYISDWHENGFPTAVAFYEGRLWWFGRGKYWGSVSDQYRFYDEFLEGDERAISGTIGFGGGEATTWAAPLERIVMGNIVDEPTLKSNSFGDPITSTNRNVKRGSGRGAAPVDVAIVDGKGYFVQAGGKKLMELEYTVGSDRYSVNDLTTLNPDLTGSATIVRIAVSTEPDTRIWCVLSDGSVAVLLIDRTENVLAWTHIDSPRTFNNGDDKIQDVVVLPGVGEDEVYFVVQRPRTVATITTHYRYLERMASFDEMTRDTMISSGGVMPMFDSFTRYTSPGTIIYGLQRLEGQTVSYFADFRFRSSATVVGGQVTLNGVYTNVILGAPYEAELVSSVIQYQPNSPLMIHKRIINLALILRDFVVNGVSFGNGNDTITKNMPRVEDGADISSSFSYVQEEYHQEPFPFDGTSETDPSVRLVASRPAKVMAMRMLVEEDNDDTSDLER